MYFTVNVSVSSSSLITPNVFQVCSHIYVMKKKETLSTNLFIKQMNLNT